MTTTQPFSGIQGRELTAPSSDAFSGLYTSLNVSIQNGSKCFHAIFHNGKAIGRVPLRFDDATRKFRVTFEPLIIIYNSNDETQVRLARNFEKYLSKSHISYSRLEFNSRERNY